MKKNPRLKKYHYLVYLYSRRFSLELLKSLKSKLAQCKGDCFYCRVLSGESDYNLSINPDMSVSCNCNDIYGNGRLGTLQLNSLMEVLKGPVARKFRAKLAKGELPIMECAVCPELIQISKEEPPCYSDNLSAPKGIQLETNGGCNLACIGCGRTERPLSQLKMPVTNVKKIVLDLKALDIRRIYFYSLGEPFLSGNILEEIELIRQEIPEAWVQISTNGAFLDNDSKRKAALLMNLVYFTIAGSSQETAARYQVGTDFERAYTNLCRLVEMRNQNTNNRTKIVWKYILFNWNDQRKHIERAIKLAEKAGVDRLVFVFTLSPFYGISWRYWVAPYWHRLGSRIQGWRWVNPCSPWQPATHFIG